MSLYDRNKKSAEKYLAKMDDLRIRMTKESGLKGIIENHAKSMGESINAFILRAIAEAMKRDKEENNWIIFRPNRPGLDEPMKEAAIFRDEELMLSHIVKIHTDRKTGPAFAIEDVYIVDEPVEETETGWKDARPVMVRQYGDDVFSCPQCIGYCATKFPRE